MRSFLVFFLGLLFSVFALAKGPSDFKMPPVVQTATVKSITWQNQATFIGSLSSLNGVTIKPEIASRITSIAFQSGQDVKKGDLLVSLDQDILQAELKSNQANLQLRQEQFKRAQELYKLHAIATADLESSRANLASAKASYDQANAQLKQAVIVAPFNGRLGLRQVSVGDYVSSGQAIINLQALDPIVVNFSVPEVYLSQLSNKSAVEVTSDAFPGQVFKGKIYAFDSTIDPQTRALAVRAEIANPEKNLLPGAFVNINLSLGTERTVIKIPETALVSSLNGLFVYKVINNKAVKTPVTVLQRDAQNAYITQGLKNGDVIVTAGQLKITGDNQPITVVMN